MRMTGMGTGAGGVSVVDGLGKEFLVVADSKVLEAVEIIWFFFVRDVDQVLNSGAQTTSISRDEGCIIPIQVVSKVNEFVTVVRCRAGALG